MQNGQILELLQPPLAREQVWRAIRNYFSNEWRIDVLRSDFEKFWRLPLGETYRVGAFDVRLADAADQMPDAQLAERVFVSVELNGKTLDFQFLCDDCVDSNVHLAWGRYAQTDTAKQ